MGTKSVKFLLFLYHLQNFRDTEGYIGLIPTLTLVLPSLFCNMVYRGGGYHPPYELEINGPKVWLFGTIVYGRVSSFHWYQNHENRSMYDVTMTFSNMAGLKKRFFSENRPKLKKKINFFVKKVPNIGISPGFLLIKKRNGVSNINMSQKF